MIAALYVHSGGVYFGLPGVTPWDKTKDARRYCGPWPVVAHPPCERWGRYWSGGPSATVRRKRGDDAGCFAAALQAVRMWGGVLEHPADSSAWEVFGLMYPPRSGGWVVADWDGGWTCCVEQGHYGHRARKATWLYANRCQLPSLTWGESNGIRMEDGFHSNEERAAARARGEEPRERLSAVERLKTPEPFRDLLLSIAGTAAHAEAA